MQLRGSAALVCAAAAFVVACFFVWWLFLRGGLPPLGDHTEQAASVPPPASTSLPVAVPAVTPADDSESGIPDPATACAGEPWEARPGDLCARSMDRRFSVERVSPVPLFTGHGGWFPDEEDEALAAAHARRDPAMPTWLDVFGDAEAARTRAEAALADPACTEGPAPRRAACAAGAVAAVGLLQEACVKPLAADGIRNPWARPAGGDGPVRFFEPAEKTEIWMRRVGRLDADPDLTVEEYWKKRRRAETAMYRYAWRVMRCAALPESVLAWFGKLPTPSGELGDDKQSKALYAFAARHGVGWAEARLRILPTLRSGPRQVLEDQPDGGGFR